jgi:hypothetical protein
MSPSRAGVRIVGSGAPPDDDPGSPDDGLGDGLAGGEGRRPSLLIVALVVLVLMGLFGTVFFWSKYHTLSSKGAAQHQVVTVSRDFLLALTNFQANTIDADFTRVQSYATGDFQSQALSFFDSDVRKALAQVQAVSRGQIKALYVQSIQGDEATTYADIDQTIANVNFKAPEQDELRIVLSLKKVAAGWRISEVSVLQAPAVPTPAPTTTTTKP